MNTYIEQYRGRLPMFEVNFFEKIILKIMLSKYKRNEGISPFLCVNLMGWDLFGSIRRKINKSIFGYCTLNAHLSVYSDNREEKRHLRQVWLEELLKYNS